MSDKRFGFTYDAHSVLASSPPALNSAELRLVTETLAENAPEWTVELLGLSAEEAALLIMPDDGDDMSGPSFVVSADPLGYRVEQMHWERVTEIGQFTSFGDALTVVRQRIGLSILTMVPATATVH